MPVLQIPNTPSRPAPKARRAPVRVRSHAARSDRFLAWTIAFTLLVAAAGAQATWRGAGFPLPRDGHALVFDQARGRTVLFGGPPIDSYELADTWEWDGTRWLHRAHAPPLPGPRAYHAMVYDTVRNRVVLHGGAISGLGYDDTWEWDGTRWERRTGVSSFTYAHAMAYDPVRRQVVRFGGVQTPTETWTYDGVAWTQHSPPTSPPPSAYHTMVFDPSRQKVLAVCGGRIDETWAWDGSTWSRLPVPLASGTLVWDSRRQRVLLVGGRTIHQLVGSSWQSIAQVPAFGSATYDTARDRVVIAGGEETWEWDGSIWFNRTPLWPPRSQDHSLAFDSQSNCTLLLLHASGDLWQWNGDVWSHPPTPVRPSPSSGHSFVYDRRNRQALLFTGTQTWTWDGASWRRASPAAQPPPRSDHAMCFDSRRGRVLLFGGGGLSDTWEWDGHTWLQRNPTNAPSWRSHHDLVFDTRRGVAVLHGGYQSYLNPMNDTWEWNGTNWQQRITSTAPPARIRPGMGYDPERGRCVLFGGELSLNVTSDTWEYDGVDWAQKSGFDSSVSARMASGNVAYDSRRGRLVMYGGSGPYAITSLRDLWDYAPASCLDMGSGQSNGLSLSCVTNPYLGQMLDLRLTTVSAFNVLFISAGTCVAPAPTVGTPFCSTTSLFLAMNTLMSAVMSGQPARILLPVPNDLNILFAPLCFQGVSLEATTCLRASNGLQVRLQQRDV